MTTLAPALTAAALLGADRGIRRACERTAQLSFGPEFV
jgi:hypothetical protein